VTHLTDLETIRYINRELIRKREEMEALKNEKDKNKALKAYTEFLTNLEVAHLRTPSERALTENKE